jgi:thiol reductant ABC exporter CydC subunit
VSIVAARTGSDRPLLRLWRLADPNRLRLALAAFLAFCALASAVGLLVVSAWLISRASQQPPILYLQVAIVGVRAFGISRGVFRYAERLVGHDAAFRSLTTIRVGVYDRLERLSPAGLGDYRRGDLLARLIGDVESSVDLIVRVLLPMLSAVAAGVLATVIGWAILPAAGTALLVLLLVSGGVAPWLAARYGTRAQRARAEAEGQLTSRVVAALSAAPDLLAYGAVDRAMTDLAQADAELTRLDRRSAAASGLGAAVSALATGVAIAACLGLGVTAVREGQVDGVWLAALVLLPLAMADVLSGMPAAALARARVVGAAQRLFHVMDAPDPVPARPTTLAMPPALPDASGPAPAPALDLAGVAARYPGAVADALQGLDLDLAPGRKVALVGPSGAGKSTVAAVLLRLLDHRDGSYRLGDADVRDLGEDAVRDVLAAVDQQAHLFDTTIEENLRLAHRDATDAQLRSAIERAALDGWIDSLPAGLQTRVGAHGSAVSGGQAQRIALARVLLADRPIVVLDEPGEHLDPAMADQVTAAALAATSDRSVVLITHRMAHTSSCDEVVVLSSGRVVQRGAPGELGGWYAEAVARERGEPRDG